MADINTVIGFSEENKKLIQNKLSDKNFKYSDWSNDDLKEIRKVIRDFYRNLTQKCTYCQRDISLQFASNCHVEHIIAKSLSPLKFIFEPKNLCVICADCNEIKKNKEVENHVTKRKSMTNYPRSSNAFLIYHPHFDNYDEHIYKCDDIYIDLSTKGSFTIHICKLNNRIHKYGFEPSMLNKSELFDLFNSIMSEENYTKQEILMKKLRKYFISLK